MGMLIAFLSLFNIALGYGLAVYLRRATGQSLQTVPVSPTVIASSAPTTVEKKPSNSTTRKSQHSVAFSSTDPDKPVENTPAESEQASDPTFSSAAEEQHFESVSEEKASENYADIEESRPPIDEENVLAGIEAFRNQLAQMKDENSAQVVEEVNTV